MQCPGKTTEIMLEMLQDKGLTQNPQSQPVTERLLFPTFPIRLIGTPKINTEPATVRAFVSPNTILIPKQLDRVLNGARLHGHCSFTSEESTKEKYLRIETCCAQKPLQAIRHRRPVSQRALAFILPLQTSRCSFLTLWDNRKA